MSKKINITKGEQQKIIEYYLDGFSTTETGLKFNLSGVSIYNILKKNNIQLRTIAGGNSLKWKNKDFRKNQIEKRKGKPSGALGKKWTIPYKVNKNNSGDKNPMWKGGKTKFSQQIKNLYEYSSWRMDIFRRDKWTCQICGAKNKKGEKYIFDADHIHPFSKILSEHNILSIEEAISCKELWDIKNGRTLCRKCHKETETWGINQYTI